MRKILILMFVLSLGLLHGQSTYSLSSDRPGLSFSPRALNGGEIQWQQGFQFAQTSLGGQNISELSLLESTFRFGFSNFGELGLSISPGWERQPTFQDNFEFDEGGLELFYRYSFSEAGDDFQWGAYLAHDFDAARAILLLSYNMNEFTLASNIGLRFLSEEGRNNYFYTLNLSYSVGRFSPYVEYVGTQATRFSIFDQVYNGGVSYLFNPNFQAELFFGRQSISGTTQEFTFINTGFSWRFE